MTLFESIDCPRVTATILNRYYAAVMAALFPDLHARLLRGVAAAVALGALQAKTAVPGLIEAMADGHHGVGYAANDALFKITGHRVEIPIGWDANTIRQYRKPLWDKWLAGQPAGH